MKIGINGIKLIKEFEGCKLKAYKCPAGVWTIGYGDTTLNGNSVKQGDIITQSQAETMLTETLKGYEIGITKALKKTLNQNQFDRLEVFAYNIGINAAKKSTLLKKVNANPNDKTIAEEFLKWNKANGGKILNGLTNRRIAEAKLYFTSV